MRATHRGIFGDGQRRVRGADRDVRLLHRFGNLSGKRALRAGRDRQRGVAKDEEGKAEEGK